MHDRRVARGLAVVVARYLPGWSVDTEWDSCGEVLCGPREARLYMSLTDKGMVHFSGCWPPGDYRPHPCGINVTTARGPAVIAAEVQTRLLPGYLAELERIQTHLTAQASAKSERSEVMAGIGEMFPGSHVRETGYRGNYTEVLFDSRSGHRGMAKAYGSAESIELELSLSRDLALEVLALMARRQR